MSSCSYDGEYMRVSLIMKGCKCEQETALFVATAKTSTQVREAEVRRYCPGGPDSDFEYSTQSYTGYEVSHF